MEILVIDDEMVMRSLITIALQRKGYTVFNVDNPLEAIKLLTSSIPDLIILDIMMPGMNGIDLCRHIRTQAADVPIVVFSALDDAQSIENAYNAGANNYLHKLQLPGELVSVVTGILKPQSPVPN
jgi:DNA-binding response OmpR family regulator